MRSSVVSFLLALLLIVVGLSTVAIASDLPECIKTDCNCSDFLWQQQAQEVLSAFPGDPYRLDRDRNGIACESLPTAQQRDNDNPLEVAPSSVKTTHLPFGNPSQATKDDLNNYLMLKPQFDLSYNCGSGIPNWVSWELNQSWLGDSDRANDFRSDPDLPEGCYAVASTDYRRSGYDRGHMTPSADRTRSKASNSSTFLMTNIVPQVPPLNREVWREPEEYSRDLVEQGKFLYVIAGIHGIKGTIANGKVAVPAVNWKIVAVLQQPQEPITNATRIIAVIMPNSKTVRQTDWKDYRVCVDDIERLTGYDFFSTVPVEIQEVVERQVDSL